MALAQPALADGISLSKGVKACRAEMARYAPALKRYTVDYEETLASARYSDVFAEDTFAEYLRSLFTDRKLDLIITIGAPAANFVQKRRQTLLSTTPALFTAAERRRVGVPEHSAEQEHDVGDVPRAVAVQVAAKRGLGRTARRREQRRRSEAACECLPGSSQHGSLL